MNHTGNLPGKWKLVKRIAQDVQLRAMTQELDPVGDHHHLFGQNPSVVFQIFLVSDAHQLAKKGGRSHELIKLMGLTCLPMGEFSWDDMVSFLYEIHNGASEAPKVLGLKAGEAVKITLAAFGDNTKYLIKR